MDQQRKVSVIIPVYNSAQYLGRCLDSVINQTYKKLEIICVNDGSKDDSLQILNKYKEIYNNIIIVDKTNEGVSAARNDGIRKATGDYITFVDSDDWLESDAIESLYNEMIYQNVDVIRGNYYINTEFDKNKTSGDLADLKNKKVLTAQTDFSEKVIKNILNGEIPCYVVLLMIKREIVFNAPLFKTDIAFMEDVVFYLELMNHINGIYFLDKPIYHYYCNPNSSSKSAEYHIRNIYNVIKTNVYIEEIMTKSKFDLKRFLEIRQAFNAKTIMSYLYAMYKDADDKKGLIREINKLLEDETIYVLLRCARLELLSQGMKIKLEKMFLGLVTKKRYRTLLTLYRIRECVEGVLKA